MYATKRRRRNVKNYKHPPKESQKSNPSKRHRERLNAELENLASLLPFEQNILTKLDKLSILRLAVSFLRIKSYFQANLKISSILQQSTQQQECERLRLSQIQYQDSSFSEGNAIFESLNGFILIVNENSEVFYTSRTVEQFIGFHQSDIIHQSVFELIHSEDRDEFKKHLQWNSMLPPDKAHLTLNEILSNKEYSKYLERNFTVRFRCLLDNTSGFLTLDIVGRLSVLHGQHGAYQIDANDEIIHQSGKGYGKNKGPKVANNSTSSDNIVYSQSLNDKSEPVLALFGIACPFGPSSLFELPQRDSLFKTKHKVNLAPISLDSKGKLLLGYNDVEFSQFGGYDLIYTDDLKYYSNGHKELLKTGSSGLICYRVQTSKGDWQWLQSSMRIIYKSNKPECILANHRPLTNEEGEELFYKRGFEFKLPYPYLYDFETNSFGNAPVPPQTFPSTTSTITPNQITTSVKTNKSSLLDLANVLSPPETTSAKASNRTSKCTTNNSVKSSKTGHKPVKSSAKQSKAQLIQQRAQQHAQQQLQLQQQQQHQQQQCQQQITYNENQLHYNQYSGYQSKSDEYYQINCKTEIMESDHGYDVSKLIPSSDYSTLSSSSTSSCSSVSSNLFSNHPDSISVNISNQCYPYSNYFNTASHQYSDSYTTESSKFYSGNTNNNSYNNGLFNYSNNFHYNYSNPYSHFSNPQVNSHILDTTLTATSTATTGQQHLISNAHSNNSSCSSTSSTSSSSSNLNVKSNNANNTSGYSNNTDSAWMAEQMDTAPVQHKSHHASYQNSQMNGSPVSYSSSSGEFQYAQGGHHGSSYNELLTNNAAVIAAASYSCATAAAASTYGAYPFSVDDYKPQIPL